MSTTSSVRRIKERGGAGGKITPLLPTKTLTPISQKPSLPITGFKSTGKENPNLNTNKSVSGGSNQSASQKPLIRPMPRVSDADSRSRSRGRSPSPSDFNRLLSDMRKNRVSSGESRNEGLNLKGGNGFRVLDKKGFRDLNQKGGRVSIDGKESGNAVKNSGKNEMDCVKFDLVDGDNAKNGVCDGGNVNHLRVNGGFKSEKSCVEVSSRGLSLKNTSSFNGVDVSKERRPDGEKSSGRVGGIGLSSRGLSVRTVSSCNGSDVVKENGVNAEGSSGRFGGVGLSSRGLSVRTGSGFNGADVVKEKGVNGEGSSGRVSSAKSTSKLHEKLTYLEGKVKRIASDIKKTKEMLDSNNTDASKVVLLDIQEKISGIEKAMGNVIADSNGIVSADCSGDLETLKGSENKRTHEDVKNALADSSKGVYAKGLSCEELEARLFPHHKLIRNRTMVKGSGFGSQTGKTHNVDLNGGSNVEDSECPVSEDPIALEFLASLTKMHSETDVPDTSKVQETEEAGTSTARRSSGALRGKNNVDLDLEAHERLEDFDEKENKTAMIAEEEMDDENVSQLVEIGSKTSTGGWFVSEGESVLLAHDDGSCSFYDIANHEEKAEYRPPTGVPENIWMDCWIVRAPSADGCSGKYVVAASAGNTMDSGFCSWDFYSKDVRAFHIEDNTTNQPRVALGPLPDNVMYRRNALSTVMSSENRQWWYRPCGPLIISTASGQRGVKVYDIRDGEQIMRWDIQKPVLAMDYSSPLQWRNRGKAVIAESEGISLWDVSSMNAEAVLLVSTSGRKISALHVNNTDAELGGGIRQRVSSSEIEGNDGVFCTSDSINILDFRQPSGIGLKIPKIGACVQSLSSKGDSVFLGCSSVVSAVKKQVNSQVLQFSIRKQKIVSTYTLPETNAHSHHKALTQVWGNSNLVMAVCGLGLFVFDALKDDGLPSFVSDYTSPQNAKETIGPDDLYSPSFDCLSSQILLISRDRPAMWRCLS